MMKMILYSMFMMISFLGWFASAANEKVQSQQQSVVEVHLQSTYYEFGQTEACPCLQELEPIDPLDLKNPNLYDKLGNNIIWSGNNNDTHRNNGYGTKCYPHDMNTPQCQNDHCLKTRHLVPSPLGCDKSWCQRSWCFVDPNNCTLTYRRSENFLYSNRFYSYATCGFMDAFTNVERFNSLEGQVFKIGINSNSGGWLGAYSKTEEHFLGPIDKWSGLAIDFVMKAAIQGQFQFELTAPPDYLYEKSVDYFESTSSFDFCVYATSLGYLDMCVAQYTITNQRASSTDWLLLGSAGIYLVVNTDESQSGTVQEYLQSVATIFSPFTRGTWLFIVVLVIPVLGSLMVVHERGRGGLASSFSDEELALVTDKQTGESVVKRVPVPFHNSIIKSIYIAFLAVLQQSYDPSVLTLGAMLNLLGIAFFILTIVAVYTANLAAILTQNVQQTAVNNLDDAIKAGYRFCGERKNMESVVSFIPSLDASMFVVDPEELGGDGLPGFSCSECSSRIRVFDYLHPSRADIDPRYCHAAIAPEEDLDVMHASSIHCNKTMVGKPIQMIQTGMPIFEQKSPQLISFFLKLKNDGEYDQALLANKPDSECKAWSGVQVNALTLTQLSGIWVVSGVFSILGLLATFFQIWYKKRTKTQSAALIRQVHKRDQRGTRHDALGLTDAWTRAGLTRGESTPSSSCRLTSETELIENSKMSRDRYYYRRRNWPSTAAIACHDETCPSENDTGCDCLNVSGNLVDASGEIFDNEG